MKKLALTVFLAIFVFSLAIRLLLFFFFDYR
jgi:hypothetical protein